MKCPSCGDSFATPVRKCPRCSFVFSDVVYDRISLYFELRNELNGLHEDLKKDIWNRLRGIDEKIERFEHFMDVDVTSLASPGSPEKKKEPLRNSLNEKPAPMAQGTATVRRAPEARGPAVPKKKDTQGFEVRLGQKWFLIIGIVTMVFGIGYFLKYSFDQGWIGPAGRVTMAYLWGVAFLMGGNWFRKKYETFGLYLIGGGIATLYFATFAAFQIYHLFSQTTSFSLMVLITVLACVLAVIYETKWLAVLGIIGGFFTPLLLSTGQDNQIALMTYMTILNLGLLGIAFYKKWDLLNTLGFVFTYVIYTAWFMSHYAQAKFWPAVIFLNIFFFTYSVIPFAYHFVRARSGPIRGFLVIAPNAFIAFGYNFFMIKERFSLEWVSIVTILYAFMFLFMATYLYRNDREDEDAFPVLIGQSALFLAITIPVIFSKHWITVFWAIQAVVLVWMGLRLDRKSLVNGGYVLFALSLGKFLLYDYQEIFHFSISGFAIRGPFTFHMAGRFITEGMILMAAFTLVRLAKKTPMRTIASVLAVRSDHALMQVVFGTLSFIILNCETSSFFYSSLPAARFAAISVLWTIFSVSLMMLGFRHNSSNLRKVAIVLFAVTLLKVFIFDMSNISTPYRIISFIILGVMLVIASYLYHKFKDRLIDAISEESGSGT